jgi:hypothetical protein
VRKTMGDLAFVLIVLAFFAAAMAFARLAPRL